jgi:S-adenosylmethionine:diacylglycerol 3-amino-3-carboxypropyl transferase
VIDRLRRRPLYAACNEDTRTELAALAPTRGDTVVCVSAGGGRALSLLGAGARRFLAVDRRESQLHVLELQAAALDALPYAALRAFVGVDPDRDRLDVHAALRASLSPRARRYWDARRSLVAGGLLYAGRLETTLARFAAWLRRTGAMRWPTAAFAARSHDEQRDVLLRAPREVVRGARLWTALFHPAAVALVLQDPSFGRSTEGRTGAYLYRRMLDFAARRRLAESFLLHLIWFGRYDPHGALPLWLTPDGAERARKGLAQLELRHATLDRVAAEVPQDAPVCWSLSDVGAWMSEPAFHALLARLVEASPAGSRLCWRHLAAHWTTPALPRLVLDRALSRRVERDDASVFYAVCAASVIDGARRR